MALKVSEVARLAGVSVRTLHHYDELGLIRPSGRSAAGYRLYAPADLERLQQVLFFRELDFPLEEIQRILSAPDFDVAVALRMQRQLLSERAARVSSLIKAVDAAITSLEKGITMTGEERFETFGDFDPKEHAAEAEERWGSSAEFKESTQRTKKYQKQEWTQIKAELNGIFSELAKLATAGDSPTGDKAMAIAERHRLHVAKWFYPCPPAMHRALGELYVTDPRFQQNIDRHAEGLAEFARQAWRANADRSSQ